jgi:hypothetical protein
MVGHVPAATDLLFAFKPLLLSRPFRVAITKHQGSWIGIAPQNNACDTGVSRGAAGGRGSSKALPDEKLPPV